MMPDDDARFHLLGPLHLLLTLRRSRLRIGSSVGAAVAALQSIVLNAKETLRSKLRFLSNAQISEPPDSFPEESGMRLKSL
jgi:hypothetical protein